MSDTNERSVASDGSMAHRKACAAVEYFAEWSQSFESMKHVVALRNYLNAGDWIPVTERLPEKGVPVIGWFPGATQSFECSLNEHDGVWCDWGTGIYLYEDERPTHWMPFPAGPTDAK